MHFSTRKSLEEFALSPFVMLAAIIQYLVILLNAVDFFSSGDKKFDLIKVTLNDINMAMSAS